MPLKRICLIAPGLLPVPATQGGAIETLMTSIVNQNELYKELDLTVVTTFDDESKRLAKSLHYTKFVLIPSTTVFERLKHRVKNVFIRRFFPSQRLSPSAFYDVALRNIRHESFDGVVFEGGPSSGITAFDDSFPGKMWYHLHYTPTFDKPFSSSASRVFAVSDFVGKAWCMNCTSQQKVITVHNGIDMSRFSRHVDAAERRRIRSSLGFTDDDFIDIFCGRIMREKGVLELLQAISEIDDQHVKLMIVGSADFGPSNRTPYVNAVVERVSHLGNRVAYIGYVPNDQLYRYLKSADIQVVPSMWEDAAPLVPVEAMAAGLPLIVTRSGGIEEYTSPECAVIVERDGQIVESLSRAIVSLQRNPDRCNKMSQAGLARAQLYGMRSMYQQFVAACK